MSNNSAEQTPRPQNEPSEPTDESTSQSQGPTQVPSPDAGDRPRSELDPSEPTATAPDSVQESVYEQADYVGKDGPDAADPPTAKRKAAGSGEPETKDDTDTDPGEDLDADEAADAFETPEQAHDSKSGKPEQRRDEDIISLDGSD